MNDSEKQTIVFIPRNFIEKGTFMGGMFKIRNAIEGGILAVLIAAPVIQLPLSLTVRIIILCMTALPAAMISLIGIGGESISAFLMNALRFLKNRRVIYRIDVNPDPKNKHRIKKPRNKEPKAKKHKHPKKKSTASMTASGQSDKYEGCPPYNLIAPITSNAFQSIDNVLAISSSSFRIRLPEKPSQAAKKDASLMA